VISVPTARALAATGLDWQPQRGDRFVIPDRGMDEEVFVLSDMTIEAHDFPTGRVLGFNGTTEWALDSVDAASVLWLPGESALRGLLGPALVRLEPDGLAGWAVTVAATGVDGDRRDSAADRAASGAATSTVVHQDAEEAYALALLAVRARSARQLLPLAAHAVTAAVGALEAGGGAAAERRWAGPSRAAGRTRHEVLAHLVEEHRWVRGVLAGVPAAQVAAQVAAQEEVDPVAEDRPGTWRRAVTASLTAWTTLEEVGDADGHDEHAEHVLLDLVVHAWDLGAPVEPVCARHVLEHLRRTGGPGTGDGTFADPLEPAPGAGEGEQLLALTGRRAAVSP